MPDRPTRYQFRIDRLHSLTTLTALGLTVAALSATVADAVTDMPSTITDFTLVLWALSVVAAIAIRCTSDVCQHISREARGMKRIEITQAAADEAAHVAGWLSAMALQDREMQDDNVRDIHTKR